MKVLILGPVINTVSGGVAVFTENLYKGFKELGDDVQIISNVKSKNINNYTIKNNNLSKNKIFFHFKKIAKIIRDYEPQLVISSLQYSLGIKKYKKYWNKATYVQVLHGAPSPGSDGKFKSFLINSSAKYSKKHFDKVVTVSYLSYSINKKINSIECDKVIHNGCDLPECINKKIYKKYDFTYIGRLIKGKGVELICDSFLELKKENKNLKLCVAGYGDLSKLFTEGKYKNSGIIYLGKIDHSKIREVFSMSKFFISFNELEPFATTYNEAILSGCNIIAPSTIGNIPLFIHKSYFHIADCINKNELTIRLKEILNNYIKIPDKDIKEYFEYFSTKRCAQEYKNLYIKK